MWMQKETSCVMRERLEAIIILNNDVLWFHASATTIHVGVRTVGLSFDTKIFILELERCVFK